LSANRADSDSKLLNLAARSHRADPPIRAIQPTAEKPSEKSRRSRARRSRHKKY
jgi:hypothetical protein